MIQNFQITFFLIAIILAIVIVGYYFLLQKKKNPKAPVFLITKNILRDFNNWLDSEAQIKVDSTTLTIKSGKKPVYVDVSAKVPEGTTIHVLLKAVDKNGKTVSQKGTLARTVSKDSVTTKSSKIVKKNTKKQVKAKSTQSGLGFQEFFTRLRKTGLTQTLRWSFQPENLAGTFLVAAVIIYALVISIGIDRFPIYFFTDEAIHMNLISDFIRDGFRNYDKEFLPTFFIAEGWVNGTSVYLQWLPYLLFGKSIVVTRLVSAFITLICATTIGLLLKQVFKIKYYWAGVLFLLTTPAWFLHARTAFEYAEVGSFYMIFLYFYSRYRDGDLRSLYFALLSGALSFYTHGLGQVLMTVTGAALFITDFNYHIHPNRRKTVLFALFLGILLLLPFARYYLAHSSESVDQIKRRASYWTNIDLNTSQKFLEFIKQYTYGLNPLYWYFHNSVDIDRHVMKGYGNGLAITLPFALVGLFKVLRNLRQFSYRIVLIAFLAAPLPASIVAIGMPRMLWMSIPLAIMTALGLSLCVEQWENYWRKSPTRLPWIVFSLLTFLSFFMLRDALVNGPLWFNDYGLYGMQYGAKQVFEETIVPELKKDPSLTFVVSPSWANGTDEFADFFVPTDLISHVRFGQPIDLVNTPSDITSNLRFILPYNDYDNLMQNPKFKDITIHKLIKYPNGTPGFYVLSLKPVDNINEILQEEELIKRTPVEDTMLLDGQEVRVVHSPFNGAELSHIFDNNPDTLVRVLEANPFTFNIYPTNAIDTHSVLIQTGSLPDFTIKISLYAPGATTPVEYANTYKGLGPDPVVTIQFDKGPEKSDHIYLEIKDNISGETSQIHVRTINFK